MSEWKMNQEFCMLAKLLDYPGEESKETLMELMKIFPNYDFSMIQDKFDDVINIQELYTRTFDFSEKTTLHITFYYSGYTRSRGMDLLALKAIFEKHGIKVKAEKQLPDYLPLILRLACLDKEGILLLAKYRQAIELIAKRLKENNNPYATLFELLLKLIPKIKDELKIEEKPKTEMVGLGD